MKQALGFPRENEQRLKRMHVARERPREPTLDMNPSEQAAADNVDPLVTLRCE